MPDVGLCLVGCHQDACQPRFTSASVVFIFIYFDDLPNRKHELLVMVKFVHMALDGTGRKE